jgi:type VI secretion system secreted protein Hcp
MRGALFHLTSQGTAMSLSIFLKIDGITGEATATGHAGEIMLQSFTWGSAAGTATTGAGAGKISFQNVTVTKVVDKASPLLFHALASGQRVPQCIVTIEQGDKLKQTIALTLSTCLIESISEVFEAAAPAPQETIVISFAKVQLQYTPQSPTGSAETPITAGWDITTNSAV